jgi:hypothetical protein
MEPPRIADSIERKTALVPALQVEPARPAMKEAAVSLAPPPPPKFNVRDASPPRKRKPPKQNAPRRKWRGLRRRRSS